MTLPQGREHVVCTEDEIPPGTHKVFPIGRHGVGVYNVNGVFYAIANYCPHEGGPLCTGRCLRHPGGGVRLLPVAPVGLRAGHRHHGGQARVEHPHLPGAGGGPQGHHHRLTGQGE